MNFQMKNRGVKRKNFFFKTQHRDKCFLHSYIYNDNEIIHKFIKNVTWKKIVYAFLITKHLYMLG